MDSHTLHLARIIWDYHQLGQEPAPADVMVVFGTNDLRVAEFAAELYARGFGQWLVCTGGVAHSGDLLATGWTQPESEMFAKVAAAGGVPRDHILLESRAMNTAENIRFTRELLRQEGIHPRNLLLVTKSFMQRRVWATMAVEWPGMPATVVSQKMTLDEYFTPELPPEKIIPIMMGDLQRTWIYADKGWSAPQEIPAVVMEAYRELAGLGFTQHLIEDGDHRDG
ncbi:MAG TPA: YdcF family protein [Bryobacteraceae bacterium]|nr:YdcF family protein [Bryobacteraceae bacterium]HPT26691.1 YdcF family protein [Bryobacteraceae bacterium]